MVWSKFATEKLIICSYSKMSVNKYHRIIHDYMVKDLHSAILLNLILVVLQYAVFILQTAYTSLVELIAFFFRLDVNSGIPLIHHRWPSSGFTFLLSFFFHSHPLQSSHFSYLALSFWQRANDSRFKIVHAAFHPAQIFMHRERERERERVEEKREAAICFFIMLVITIPPLRGHSKTV